MEKRLFNGFFDTAVIAFLVVIFAIYTDGLPLRIGIGLCLILSILEIGLAKRVHGSATPLAHTMHHYEISILIIACFLVLGYDFVGAEWILIIGVTMSADAGGLAFGKALGGEKVSFLSTISPNKTYAGYIGEALCSWVVGMMIVLIFDIEIDWCCAVFLVTAWLVAVVGDLLGSICKRSLYMKDSDEVLRHVPILGKVEVLARSRHGFLDCFDSLSIVFIYFAFLKLFMRSLT